MEKYLQIVAASPLLRGIAQTELKTLLQSLSVQLKVYPKNSFIWQAGDQVHVAGVVVAGSVHILQIGRAHV